MKTLAAPLTAIFLVCTSVGALAQVTSSNAGFPGGSTSMFSSAEDPNLSSPFGVSTTSPTKTSSGTATTTPLTRGYLNNSTQAGLPPSGATNRGLAAGTPGDLGGTTLGFSTTTGTGVTGTMGETTAGTMGAATGASSSAASATASVPR